MLQVFRGTGPLSRAALSGRFAAVATVFALMLLPLVPAEYFYHRAAIFTYDGSLRPGIHWRVGLILPIVAISAFVQAYVWAARAGRVYFSALRGLLCALLTFGYAAVFVSLLGHALSDETLPFIRLALAGLLFVPYLWLIPAIGAVAGVLLARGIAPEPMHSGARLRHAVRPLVLCLAPLFAIVGISQFFPPPESEISKATLRLSDEVWARFDAGDAEGVYALFSQESKKLLDHDQFVAKLTAAWRKANALPAGAATAAHRPARGTRKRVNWRIYTRSRKFEVSSMQIAAGGQMHETAVFDLSSGRPELYGIAIGFDNGNPAENIIAPRRYCSRTDAPLLHCGLIDEPMPRPFL
jgi:hypothetical protein